MFINLILFIITTQKTKHINLINGINGINGIWYEVALKYR
jgi:hypothetical protein